MKKGLLAVAIVLALAGCKDKTDAVFESRTPVLNLSTNTSVSFVPDNTVQNANREARSVSISLPSALNWTRFQLFDSATSTTSFFAGTRGTFKKEILNLTVGSGAGRQVGLSIQQLLRLSKQGGTIRFFNDAQSTGILTLSAVQAAQLQAQIGNMIQYFKSAASEAGDDFGQTVSISKDGKVIAVGASDSDANADGSNGDETGANAVAKSGAVFIFEDLPATTAAPPIPALPAGWRQTAVLKFSDTPAENVAADKFGRTVSLSDDGLTLAVAMPGDDRNGTGVKNANATARPADAAATVAASGAVIIFTRADINSTTWSKQAILKGRTETANLGFSAGSLSLSGDGNTLAVTSAGKAATTAALNGVTLFTRSGTTWTVLGTANLIPTDIEADGTDNIGRGQGTLAFNTTGTVLAVGASGNDSPDTTPITNNTGNAVGVNSGAVYVYSRDNSTAEFTEAPKFIKAAHKASAANTADVLAPAKDAGFGISLDLDATGNVLAVGTQDGFSEAYIYDYNATTKAWDARYTLENALKPSDNATESTGFGRLVKLADDSQSLAIFTPSTRRSPGITNTDATGNVIAATSAGSGTLSLYQLGAKTQAKATRDFTMQATRPVANENYQRFGHWVAYSGNGNMLAGGVATEDSDATRINLENDNSNAVSSGAVWAIQVK